jgi:hypothetical protein
VIRRTKSERDQDLAIGREIERKDAEIERLAAENEKLLEALRRARIHVQATNEAEHMMDGFGPRRSRPSDDDLATVDAALNSHYSGEQK